jgi:hypothetical protein
MRLLLRLPTNKLPLRIHRQRMRRVELARSAALGAPFLDVLAGLVELDDAVVAFAAVTVADKDIAVRRDKDRRGHVEIVRIVSATPAWPRRIKHLAVGTELDHLMALRAAPLTVGDPDIALAIDVNAVGKHEHSGAKRFHELTQSIEFQDRIEIGTVAGVGAAAVNHPHALSVRVDVDAGAGAPGAARRHFCPIEDRLVRIGPVFVGVP